MADWAIETGIYQPPKPPGDDPPPERLVLFGHSLGSGVAIELARYSIAVNAVGPGTIETPSSPVGWMSVWAIGSSSGS